jgi:ABC-type nitrate/sulfonate/bicarbonate transport system substrate-binding protein
MASIKPMEAKVIYRSNHSQLALISLLEGAGIWEKVGIEVTRMDLKRAAIDAENELIEGKCNVIFGCHITPHWRVANGTPMVCMAQTVNVAEDILVSAKPIHDLKELKDKTLAESHLCNDEGHLTSHPRGTHELYLRGAGLSSNMMEIVPPQGEQDSTKLILDGKADAVFTSASSELACKKLGLHTKVLPSFPMVNSITLTSLMPYVEENPELYLRMTKALAMGIAFIHREKEKTLEILGGRVGERLGIADDQQLESYYKKMLNILEPRLCPKYDSLYNAYRIAEIVYPDLKEKGNPVKLWDLHFIRSLEVQGFFDELYR